MSHHAFAGVSVDVSPHCRSDDPHLPSTRQVGREVKCSVVIDPHCHVGPRVVDENGEVVASISMVRLRPFSDAPWHRNITEENRRAAVFAAAPEMREAMKLVRADLINYIDSLIDHHGADSAVVSVATLRFEAFDAALSKGDL